MEAAEGSWNQLLSLVSSGKQTRSIPSVQLALLRESQLHGVDRKTQRPDHTLSPWCLAANHSGVASPSENVNVEDGSEKQIQGREGKKGRGLTACPVDPTLGLPNHI